MKKTVWVILFCIYSSVIPSDTVKNINKHYYGVVLAGGVGERLWPYSRRNHPKQFLSVDQEKSLLEQSIDRLSLLIDPDNIWLVASAAHKDSLEKDLPIGRILFEPVGRNTGPAILYACIEIYKKDPDAVIVFVPADPYIPEKDYNLFQEHVLKLMEFATKHEGIGLLGVKPTFPATGYGYIEYDQESYKDHLYKVARFHEKPSEKLASFYVQMPQMLWNICMFAGQAKSFIDEYAHVAPDLYHELQSWYAGMLDYEQINSISIDYAVIERSNKVWVMPASFSWCDVGNIEIFLQIKNQFSPKKKQVIAVDSVNSLVDVPTKVVALIGVDDICVVETDDALLITKRKDAEKVRNVVAQLKLLNQTEYL